MDNPVILVPELAEQAVPLRPIAQMLADADNAFARMEALHLRDIADRVEQESVSSEESIGNVREVLEEAQASTSSSETETLVGTVVRVT